ncbi:hypothetical protein BKA61DRAFT_664117 [Leptodontidium sp. MPI-SDFR-AT-0119]|nr:hypothetical protein BKA61DRAFT_664117 [Leptodontidium sp. MPI-SDFR-AT-0119]
MDTLPQSNEMSGTNTCRALILHPTARFESANLSADQVNACLAFIKDTVRSNKFDHSKSLGTFALFPKLPIELRLIIFRYAVNNLPGRNVFKRTYFYQPKLPLKNHMYHCDPPLMHVNHESRRVTQQVYQTFNVSIQQDNNIPVVLSPLCFNPKIDTLMAFGAQVNGFWSYESALSYPRQIRQTVQHLVVPFGGELNLEPAPDVWMLRMEAISTIHKALEEIRLLWLTLNFLDSFPALKRLTLAVCPYEMAFIPKLEQSYQGVAEFLAPGSWDGWTLAIDTIKFSFPRWEHLVVNQVMIVRG